MTFEGCGLRAAESPVCFMHLGSAERFAQALERLRCFCKDTHTADRTVEAVRNAHKYFPGLSVTAGDICFESLRETFVSGFVSLHYLPDLLVYNEQVVIFKKNPGLKVPDLIVCKCSVLHFYWMETFTRFWSPSALRGFSATLTFLAGTCFAKSQAFTRFARSTAIAAL